MKTNNFNLRSKRNLVTTFAFFTVISVSSAQQITINERSSLVMNGNVSLVVNNASLVNNGQFAAGKGEVKFTGYNDSTVSNLKGSSQTVFYDLTISKAAHGVALKSAAAVRNTLNIQGGNLYTNNNITLKSDAVSTARVAPIASGSSITGRATVERFIPARRAWRMLTAPVSSSNTIFEAWQNAGVYQEGINTFITGPAPSQANGLDVSPQNNYSLKTWNSATLSFTNIANTHVPLSAGTNGNADNTGYFIFVRGDRNTSNFSTAVCNETTLSSNGNLQQGTQTFTVSPANGGYTLVGNPYASPVNFSDVTKNNVVNRFYVWDPSLNTVGGYVMLDDLSNSGTYIKSVSSSNQTKEIQSGQAMMIQTLSAGPASVVFNENNKATLNNTAVFRPISNHTQKLSIDLNIIHADGTALAADGTFAEFYEGFSSAVDYADALKFVNVNECVALVRNNTTLTAERRPLIENNDSLFIKLWKTTVGTNYQFTINPAGMEGISILLNDNYTGISTTVSALESTLYNFNVDANPASSAANRFYITLNPFVVLPVTISSIKAAIQNNTVAINWTVEAETNIEKYEVERSSDGTNFEGLVVVLPQNTGSSNNYKTPDVTPLVGANFYRIKVYEKNGEVKYSAVVKVMMAKKAAAAMSIYPNPVTNGVINLQLTNQPGGTYKLSLTNAIGQVIFTGSKIMNSTTGTVQINLPSALQSGMYQLEVISPANEKQVLQVIAE